MTHVGYRRIPAEAVIQIRHDFDCQAMATRFDRHGFHQLSLGRNGYENLIRKLSLGNTREILNLSQESRICVVIGIKKTLEGVPKHFIFFEKCSQSLPDASGTDNQYASCANPFGSTLKYYSSLPQPPSDERHYVERAGVTYNEPRDNFYSR